MGAHTEFDIASAQGCDFAVTKSRLNGDEQQSLVSPSHPCAGIGSRYQRRSLFVGQKFYRPARKPLRRESQNPLALQGQRRLMNGHKLEEGVQGGQAVITSPRTVGTLVFEVIEEFTHEGDIEIFHAQLGRRPSEALYHEPE